MENYISRFFRFQWNKNPWLCSFTVGTLIIVLGLIGWTGYEYRNCPEWIGKLLDLYINLLASLLAFLFAYLIFMALTRSLHRHEDKLKVNYNNEDIGKQYCLEDGTHPYLKKDFALPQCSNTFTVYCNDLFVENNHLKWKVIDDPKSHFELDTYIKMHAAELLGAHSQSTIKHTLTVRLCDFELAPDGLSACIKTGRSTYLAHLLTNRVLDYEIEPNVTIRKIYENTNFLFDPSRSKMSNHIGINALVLLTGEKGSEYLVVPKRGKNATVVKNGVTASIADRLKMDSFTHRYNDQLTENYILHTCIEQSLPKALFLTKENWKTMDMANLRDHIHFLGLARDPYEGGKPTLFYMVTLPMTRREFWAATNQPTPKKEDVDAVEEIFLTQLKDISMDGDRLCFKTIYTRNDGKVNSVSHTFEQNLISNFWFYTEWLKKNAAKTK